MNQIDSITQFFYNLVPGSIFIIMADNLLDLHIINLVAPQWMLEHKEFQIFIIISLGLILGFIFQGITKFNREESRFFNFFNKIRIPLIPLNIKLWRDVVKEDLKSYEKALGILFEEGIIEKKLMKNFEKFKERKEEDYLKLSELRRTFYLMNNFIEGKIGRASLVNHFSSRAAFWSNILWGALFLGIMTFIQKKFLWFLILDLVFLFSYGLSVNYLKRTYDVVLKTFLILLKLKKKN